MLILLNSLWLGILTSISPCPLANNIAMISYLSKNSTNSSKKSLLLSLSYTLGRVALYICLGIFLSFSMDKIGLTSLFLQKQMNIVLGILLILIGLIILGIINIKIGSGDFLNKMKEKYKNTSYFGVFLLGVISASAFCPVSAGLFFGNLVQNKGNLLAFLFYGFGTSIPIVLTSLLVIFAKNKIGSFYKKVGAFEKYSTKITGLIFLAIGVYLIATHL